MKNYFEVIPPADDKTLLFLTDVELSLISRLTDKKIMKGYAPLIGAYLTLDGKRICENEPDHKDLQFAYEWSEEGELVCIYIGAEIHGPLLSWRPDDGWRNLYGHGNHGKNGACGGNWSSDSKRMYPIMLEALGDRDYIVGTLTMHRSTLIEGPAIIDALHEIAEGE